MLLYIYIYIYMYVWKGATKSLNRLQRVMRDVCVHRKDNIKIIKTF